MQIFKPLHFKDGMPGMKLGIESDCHLPVVLYDSDFQANNAHKKLSLVTQLFHMFMTMASLFEYFILILNDELKIC
jgi:hypothetical protein